MANATLNIKDTNKFLNNIYGNEGVNFYFDENNMNTFFKCLAGDLQTLYNNYDNSNNCDDYYLYRLGDAINILNEIVVKVERRY